jgi:alpha-glucosidase
LESRSSETSSKRDWYIWRDGIGKQPPNNWKSLAGGSAWEFDEIRSQYYYHSFFKEQPDLNWRNEELSKVFFKDIEYWLELGVDGFRLDVINMIAKDKKFRNNPYFLGIPFLQDHIYTRNRRKSFKIVRDLRKLSETYSDKVLVGEIYTQPPGNSEVAARYLDEGKGLHMAFDFSLIFQFWSAKKYFQSIRKWYEHIPVSGWPCNVLSNHDLFRSIDRFPWRRYKEEKAKVAAMLLLTLKGTPFIYYGEEIGMRNAKIKHRDIRDPFGKKYWPFYTGRDKARTPMQWDNSIHAGFSSHKPWLPVNDDSVFRNVQYQENQADSLLNFYRELISIRKQLVSLQMGRWVPLLTGASGVLVYARIHKEERTIVVLNFTSFRKRISLPAHSFGYVLFSTHRKQREIHFFRELRIFPFESTIFTETQNWMF